jgi:hypothetical protein
VDALAEGVVLTKETKLKKKKNSLKEKKLFLYIMYMLIPFG